MNLQSKDPLSCHLSDENPATRLLSSCHFIDEDDITYLKDDMAWIDKFREELEADEILALFELIERLHLMGIEEFTPVFYRGVLKNFLNETQRERLKEYERKKKDLVRDIFLATVLREHILREETPDKMREARESFLGKFPFLQDENETGCDVELTWLNRYARALKYLSTIYDSNKGKKTLMMGVATHLQGSPVDTAYPTGSGSKPTTRRRVKLLNEITNYVPKKGAQEEEQKQEQELEQNQEIDDEEEKTAGKRPLSNPASPSKKRVKCSHIGNEDVFMFRLGFALVFLSCKLSEEVETEIRNLVEILYPADKCQFENGDNVISRHPTQF
eukprot:gene5967-6414_t